VAALHFIHSNNVIHGDLQCHNIPVDAHLDAKVADFGGSSLGMSGLLGVVTASHRYPGELLSRLADIFALGSTMYEIVSGQPPYNGREDKEIIDMFQQGRYPPTQDFGRIGVIISNCWHGRYRDAEQVLQDVDGISILCHGLFVADISQQLNPEASILLVSSSRPCNV
jgi:serine/threonine protein kinase